MFLRNSSNRDAGSTLVPVVVLTTVALVITAVLGNVFISSLNFTSRSEAQIQAELAAEAGLIFAKKQILSCETDGATPSFTISQEIPNFDAEIWNKGPVSKPATPTSPTPEPTGTPTQSCPGPGVSADFLITSTGYSTLPTSLFNSSPLSVTMEERVYYEVGGPFKSGPAGFFGGTNAKIPFPPIPYSTSGTSPLVFAEGFDCTIPIENDVVVLGGTLKLSSGCLISGTVWYKSDINGDGVPDTNPVNSGGTITGVKYDLLSPTSPAPPVSTDQKWIIVGDTPTDWLSAGFDRVVNIPTSGISCSLPTLDSLGTVGMNGVLSGTLLDTVLDGAGPGGCGPTGVSGDLNLNLRTDVVIMADKFTLQRLKIRSADSSQRRVWIIVPDMRTPPTTTAPPCGPAGTTEKISIKDFDIDITKVSVMLYTTGTLELGNPRVAEVPNKDFRGQIISCEFRDGEQIANFYFDPMGVPNYNLDTGESIEPDSYPRSAQISFKRDIAQ